MIWATTIPTDLKKQRSQSPFGPSSIKTLGHIMQRTRVHDGTIISEFLQIYGN